MAVIVEYDEAGYNNALKMGWCSPPAVFSPFINVDRKAYESLQRKSGGLNLRPVEDRLDDATLSRLRGALALTLRYSNRYLASYRFFINEFINAEWLSTVDWHKFHRDHIVHQPMAVYVGMSLLHGHDITSDSPFARQNLLRNCISILRESNGCNYLMEYLKEMGAPDIYFEKTPASQKLWEILFLDTFFLAALFHDIGYPWLFMNILNDKLGAFGLKENPYRQSAEVVIENYGTRLLFYPLNGYKKVDHTAPVQWSVRFRELLADGLSETHGVQGAITLLYLNDLIRKYPDSSDRPVRRFCVEWAAMAVMMHDMARFYGKIENGALKVKNPHLRILWEHDPLSFLLTIIDQIQDFGRPDAVFEKNESGIEVHYGSRCKAVKLDWERETKTLRIIYVYRYPGDYVKEKNHFLPYNEQLYFDPYNGYLEYSGLDISRIELEAVLA